jgi:spermidine/putrescine transport system permease protein
VTVPATRQGALAGLVLVFLPAVGDFVSAQLMGGPDQYMIGNLIQQKFFEGNNQPLGSALTMVLMLVLLVGMIGYLRRARKDEQDAVR